MYKTITISYEQHILLLLVFLCSKNKKACDTQKSYFEQHYSTWTIDWIHCKIMSSSSFTGLPELQSVIT